MAPAYPACAAARAEKGALNACAPAACSQKARAQPVGAIMDATPPCPSSSSSASRLERASVCSAKRSRGCMASTSAAGVRAHRSPQQWRTALSRSSMATTGKEEADSRCTLPSKEAAPSRMSTTWRCADLSASCSAEGAER